MIHVQYPKVSNCQEYTVKSFRVHNHYKAFSYCTKLNLEVIRVEIETQIEAE